MSVDTLQEKIRKTKNPTALELNLSVADLPPQFEKTANGYSSYCRGLLEELKQYIPAVRFSFSAFALNSSLDDLKQTMSFAREQGYYVILDAPELLSPSVAKQIADTMLSEDSAYPCDALVISGYMGSDVIKPFLPYCKKGKKDIFVVARTANKSAPELQDLLSGTRLVHAVAADHVNRYGADTAEKFGYTRVGILAAASSAESLRSLRAKYPKLFILIDGYDYPNANAKNCSFAFDKYGHGAVVCSSGDITRAWKDAQEQSEDLYGPAKAAAERMKKNLGRYVTIL